MTGAEHEAAPRMRTLRLPHRGGALEVAYVHRTGHDETLLYLHGLGSAVEDFHGAWTVPDWARYELVAFDAPGCGATGGYRPGVPLGVDDIVETATAVTRSLGLTDITVIGHSMGGLAALLFAARYPDLVRRLVSVEGNLGPADCSIYSRRVFEEAVLGREDAFLEELKAELAKSGVTGFDRAARALRHNVEGRAFFDYCRSIVEYSDEGGLLDTFLRLDVPKLYVHGDENADLPHIPRLRKEGVEVCAVPDCNHFPAWSNPDFYYRALARFMVRTRP